MKIIKNLESLKKFRNNIIKLDIIIWIIKINIIAKNKLIVCKTC